jgi:hypothetical protein
MRERCNPRVLDGQSPTSVKASKVPRARSNAQGPTSKVQRSKVQGPRSKVQGPRSKVQRPRSNVQGPTSKVPTSKVQRPRSNVQRPTSNGPRSALEKPPHPGVASGINVGEQTLDIGPWTLDDLFGRPRNIRAVSGSKIAEKAPATRMAPAWEVSICSVT